MDANWWRNAPPILPMIAFDLQARPRLVPRARLQTDPVSGESLLLYPNGILVLDETAQEIVTRCDGHTTLASILSAIAEEYDGTQEELKEDVVEYLDQLMRRNLLVIAR